MARLTKKAQRIKQANELLENEALSDIFESRERDIIESWKGSETLEKRESCYYEITALEELRDSIYATATDDD